MDMLLTTSDWAVVTFLIPIVVALAQVVKGIGLDVKYVPLVDIFLGVLGAYFYVPSAHNNVPMGILIGIIIGLSASGLYSGGKNTINTFLNGNGSK